MLLYICIEQMMMYIPRDSADCIQMQILYACIGKRHERKSKSDA